MEQKTQAQIKSIRPKAAETGDYYEFDVEVVSGSESKHIHLTAEQVFDCHQCQVIIAHYTGCLLEGTQEGWLHSLRQVWQSPQPVPDRSGELEHICRVEDEMAGKYVRAPDDQHD
jgi:hypothetical protein